MPLALLLSLLPSLAAAAAAAAAQPFTQGNVVALRLGSATAPFAVAQRYQQTAEAYLDEYSPAGALVQSIALPASAAAAARLGPGSARLSVSSRDAFAGGLSRSQDGMLLLLGGFDADAGVAGADASFANVTNRVVAKVFADGSLDTTTRLRAGFHGNPATGVGGCIRFAASDDGTDVYVAGTNALDGPMIAFVNYSQYANKDGTDTVVCVRGDFRGSDVHEDRLFATGTDGWVYAIEDLRSVRPGLPSALFDSAYPPTSRKIIPPSSRDTAIAGLDLTGAFVEGSTRAWVASGDATRCLDQYSLVDWTPEDYVFDYGYLDGGKNDIYGGETKLLNLAGAKALCDTLDQCAGFTFFYNASFYDPPRPWKPEMPLQTYMKGPLCVVSTCAPAHARAVRTPRTRREPFLPPSLPRPARGAPLFLPAPHGPAFGLRKLARALRARSPRTGSASRNLQPAETSIFRCSNQPARLALRAAPAAAAAASLISQPTTRPCPAECRPSTSPPATALRF